MTDCIIHLPVTEAVQYCSRDLTVVYTDIKGKERTLEDGEEYCLMIKDSDGNIKYNIEQTDADFHISSVDLDVGDYRLEVMIREENGEDLPYVMQGVFRVCKRVRDEDE